MFKDIKYKYQNRTADTVSTQLRICPRKMYIYIFFFKYQVIYVTIAEATCKIERVAGRVDEKEKA